MKLEKSKQENENLKFPTWAGIIYILKEKLNLLTTSQENKI